MKKIVTIILCLLLLTSCSPPNTASVPENKPTSVQQQTDKPDAPPPAQKPPKEKVPADSTDKPSPEKIELSEESPSVQLVSLDIIGLDGNIIFSGNAEYREGITVLDVLLESAKSHNIAVVYSGGKSSAYVTSIAGLKERQHGPASGWIYTLNGESVMVPCGKQVLSPGDSVEWTYITEFN